MDFYLYKNDQNIGPLTESEVVSGLRTGRFLPTDLGCRVGESTWNDLSFLFPLETSATAKPAPKQTTYLPDLPTPQLQPARVVHEPVVVYQPAPVIGGGNTSDMTRLMYFEANKKSTGTAYLLLFFLGGFGAHRFYLGKPGTAIAQAVIWWGSLLLIVAVIGLITMWITPIWLFIDLFLIPQMVSEHNNKLLMQANSFR